MPEEKGPEDIVSRLEALRKRVPEEKASRPPPPRPAEEGSRRWMYRIVGIIVLLAVIGVGGFAAYMFMYKPIQETELAKVAALLQAKQQKANAINDALAGLPGEYVAEKSSLLASVDQATTVEQVNAIDVTSAANRAWRAYTADKAEKIGKISEKIEMKIEKESYRGLIEIRQRISVLAYADLKGATFREIKMIQVPMRLKRETVGAIAPGDTVNILYRKNATEMAHLAKNAKVIAVLRARVSGSINLDESEKKSDTGGGVEGMGTVGSLSIGAASATLAGQYEGSTGLKMRQTQTTYKVEISELQKAAAAGKIDEEYMLSNFGVTLNKIEEKMGLGDLDVELLIIAEVSDTEETELALRAVSTDDRKNLIITKVV